MWSGFHPRGVMRGRAGRDFLEAEGTAMLVLNLVLIGLAVTLDPLPLTAFLVVLQSKRGVRKGAAFTFGWLASLAIVVTITVAATGNNPPKSSTGRIADRPPSDHCLLSVSHEPVTGDLLDRSGLLQAVPRRARR